MFTDEEAENLLSAFAKLGVKPKADLPEDLLQWMKGLGQAQTMKHEAPQVDEVVKDEIPHVKEEKYHVTALSRPPRLSTFTGEKTKGNEVPYDLWRYELDCLCESEKSTGQVLEAVRHSLKGEAGLVVMRMGHNVTVPMIKRNLDSIYGSIDKKGTILPEFYSAQQKNDESVSKWACRLEEILSNRTKYIKMNLIRC